MKPIMLTIIKDREVTSLNMLAQEYDRKVELTQTARHREVRFHDGDCQATIPVKLYKEIVDFWTSLPFAEATFSNIDGLEVEVRKY